MYKDDESLLCRWAGDPLYDGYGRSRLVFSPLFIVLPTAELTKVGYGLGASMYGMGMGMPYPYGMTARNPYAYTGMVCIPVHIALESWQELIARANRMAVRYRILNPTPWISNSESCEERAVSKRHNAMLTLYNYKNFAV